MLENEDLDWIEETNFDITLPFNGFEYWIDIEKLDSDERTELLYYLNKISNKFDLRSVGRNTRGVVIHCGMEDTDYEPTEYLTCTMPESFYEDAFNTQSIYVDGVFLLEAYKIHFKSTIKENEDEEWLEFEPNIAVVLDIFLRNEFPRYDNNDFYEYFENLSHTLAVYEINLEDTRRYYDKIIGVSNKDYSINFEHIQELQEENRNILNDIQVYYEKFKPFILDYGVDLEDLIQAALSFYKN